MHKSHVITGKKKLKNNLGNPKLFKLFVAVDSQKLKLNFTVTYLLVSNLEQSYCSFQPVTSKQYKKTIGC